MARVLLTDLTIASALVLAVASLVVADSIPTECPKTDVGNITVNLAHETDCTKYYGCSGGKKYLKECPLMDTDGNRLHFNPVLQVCDWPENVNCKLPITRAAVMPKVGIRVECPKSDPLNETIHLAHETDCTKFYKCSYGAKYVMDCPAFNEEGDKLYFNAILAICDWPWNVDCKQPETKNMINKAHTQRKAVAPVAEIPTECPKSDSPNNTVHLAHETDCTKFYKCSHGVKVVMDCPVYNEEGDRLYFNVARQFCDWPRNVDCKQPETKNKINKAHTQRKAVAPVAEIPTECPKSDSLNNTVHLAHETDCTKFYKCSHGVKVEMDCPVYNEEGDRLYFNVARQFCDWPRNVDCKQPETKNKINKAHTQRKAVAPVAEIPTECPKSDSLNNTVHLAHETDCTKFYKCSHGVKVEMDCPVYNEEGDRLYFNVARQFCDWPWNVDCKQPETKNAINKLHTQRKAVAPVAEIPTQCPKVDPIGKTVNLAHETDCTKYYACSHGKKWLMVCPTMNEEGDKLHFNASTQLCDFPENANCNL